MPEINIEVVGHDFPDGSWLIQDKPVLLDNVGDVRWFTVRSGLPAPNDWLRQRFIVAGITVDADGRCVVKWEEYNG